MKAVLLSIRPEWGQKIFGGEKTIEVRKTVPNLETPFTVYVYQTRIKVEKGDSFIVVDALNENLGGGKVIGSFVCDGVFELKINGDDCGNYWHEWDDEGDIQDMCLSYEELETYLGKSVGYGWHITEPKLFDKPRDITEFALYGKCAEDCDEYDFCARDNEDGRMSCKYFKRTFLKRPPQSYCFVETDER